MKKLGSILTALAFLASLSLAAAEDKKSQTIDGWITDAKCAPKVAGDCAKKCADAGEPLVVVSEKDKTIYKVDNQDAVKAHAGHHVNVTGTITGDTMHVDKVTMAKEPAAEKKAPGL